MAVPELYQEVNRLLTTRLLPEIKYNGKGGMKVSKGRRNTFGFIGHCMKYVYAPRYSSMNLKYAELYLALRRLGDAIVPFRYDAITVNQNNICGPHRDKGNLGSSLLVTGGDYEGGSFVLEGEEQDTRYNPIVFDGHRLHWNNPFTGMRWSIIFFKIEILPKWQHMFPADVNDPNRDWSLLRDYDGIGAAT
jgi:hypothetical protein